MSMKTDNYANQERTKKVPMTSAERKAKQRLKAAEAGIVLNRKPLTEEQKAAKRAKAAIQAKASPLTEEQKAAKCNQQKARRKQSQLAKAVKRTLERADNPDLGTDIHFVGIDGEAVKTGKVLKSTFNGNTLTARESFYVCLQAVGGDGVEVASPLVEPQAKVGRTPKKSLSTLEIFEWLLSPAFLKSKVYDSEGKPIKQINAKGEEKFVYKQAPTLVGFYLNYDFQNWIRDLPINKLQELSANNETAWNGYKIKYIPKKIFEVTDLKRPHYRTVKVQDYAGYFPGSFIGACEDSHLIAKWDKKDNVWKVGSVTIEHPETDERVTFAKILDSGKAERSNFDVSKLAFGAEDSIMEYNRVECLLMARMMTKLANTVNKAFPPITIDHDGNQVKPFEFFEFESAMSYGAGALANAIYKSMDWKDSKPDFTPLINFASHNYEWRTKILLDPKIIKKIACDFPQYADEYSTSVVVNYQHFEEAQYYNDMVFFKCFFGGRIESAAMGEWKTEIVNGERGVKLPNGEWKSGHVAMWAYDVNSAYPAAIYKMPDWNADSIRSASGGDIPDLLQARVAGMVHLEWNLPTNWVWYPFPYRLGTNVYFPASGKGWITLLEFYAFVDCLTAEELPIYAEWVKLDKIVYLEGSGGKGDGLHDDITFTGRTIFKLYNERAALKAQVDFDELAFKIALNSFYGKLVQQIGVSQNIVIEDSPNGLVYSETMQGANLKNLNSFAASWVTGFCRAMIWRGIAPVKKDKTIVAVQTDGIYSLAPLPYLETSKVEYKDANGGVVIIDGEVLMIKQLGLWDVEEYAEYCNLMPGIYRTITNKGKETIKVRGMPKKLFDFDCAKDVTLFNGKHLFNIMSDKNHKVKMSNKDVGTDGKLPFTPRQMKLARNKRREYVVSFESFVQHELAVLRPDSLNGMVLQWVEVEKQFKPSLAAKRRNWKMDINVWSVEDLGEQLTCEGAPHWTLPKLNGNDESTPYDLKFGLNGDSAMMIEHLEEEDIMGVLLSMDENGNYSDGSRRE